ncbi:MAG: secondary thiamine-phosphate synthase enzyme YjbQ [Candidatus Hatepunaea meridiana]|nr:secondary thiamine-phosphate synthase enzyme YjbQ [Candidatus Hatepunaea meridiana]
MKVHTETIELKTNGFPDIIDLSHQINDVLSKSGVINGIMTIFVPGSTAGITTIEYEPGLLKDLPALCERLAPRGVTYQHDEKWHDGNGYSHLLAALFKPSLQVPVLNSKLTLGTWQQVALVDFDNRPRHRKLIIQVMGVEE